MGELDEYGSGQLWVCSSLSCGMLPLDGPRVTNNTSRWNSQPVADIKFPIPLLCERKRMIHTISGSKWNLQTVGDVELPIPLVRERGK